MSHFLTLQDFAKVVESDDSPQLASVDEQVKHALVCLKRDGAIVHGYDYVWIMRYINEVHLKKSGLFFSSVNSYREYVKIYFGIDDIASLSTLSHYYSSGKGRFPEWTFTDTNDATERLRRVNVARRFASAFSKGSKSESLSEK